MRKIIIVISAIVFLTSCKKEPNKPNNRLVIGSWKWEKTYSPWAPYITRRSSEALYILTFNSNRTFTFKQNDTLLRSGTYQFRYELSINSNVKEWLLFYSDFETGNIISIIDNKLYISANGIDANSNEYSRY